MTRAELNELKAKLADQKDKSADMEVVASKLFGLLGSIHAVLPNEVKELLKKYGYGE